MLDDLFHQLKKCRACRFQNVKWVVNDHIFQMENEITSQPIYKTHDSSSIQVDFYCHAPNCLMISEQDKVS